MRKIGAGLPAGSDLREDFMREVFTMWRSTRMIVFVAITAALYAAILIPFTVLPIIPGYTDIRPGIVVPMICAFFFGPAASWGAAFGNVIGDMFCGRLGLGSLFGFAGNWAFGFIPYALWKALAREEPPLRSATQWMVFLLIAVTASAACAGIIAWGLDCLRLLPFFPVGVIIFSNDAGVSLVLAPICLALLYPRLKKRGSLYTQVMPEMPGASAVPAVIGTVIASCAAVGLIVFGSFFSWQASQAPEVAKHLVTALLTAPFVAALFIGLALL
jgi:energy-coupling factor transport system substrate-specific component